MESVLSQLGLNRKEAKFYLFLLAEGLLTAAQIAKNLHESRTNTYMVLDKLSTEGLIQADTTTNVKRFGAVDPVVLDRMLGQREADIKKTRTALNGILPRLRNSFISGQPKRQRPETESTKKYRDLISELVASSDDVEVIIEPGLSKHHEAWALIEAIVADRAALNKKVRLIHHASDKIDVAAETRTTSERSQTGNIVMAGRKVVLISHEPKLSVTVMDNDVLKQTFATIFKRLWTTGKGDDR